MDYYRTVTGPGRIETYEDPGGGETVRVLRVERVSEIVTCCDCWEQPAVQGLLKQARCSGVLPGT